MHPKQSYFALKAPASGVGLSLRGIQGDDDVSERPDLLFAGHVRKIGIFLGKREYIRGAVFASVVSVQSFYGWVVAD